MIYKEIVVGQEYILRNGLKTGKIRKSNCGTSYRFEAEVEVPHYSTPSIFSWKENGRYLTNTIDHQFDIVIKTQYFMVNADSAKEAEQNVLDELEECYDSDYDIEQT